MGHTGIKNSISPSFLCGYLRLRTLVVTIGDNLTGVIRFVGPLHFFLTSKNCMINAFTDYLLSSISSPFPEDSSSSHHLSILRKTNSHKIFDVFTYLYLRSN